ncbi:MAG: glycosyltransferase family 2 protein [Desulfarculaceae bacterium]|nr:glycosyltransferase family 2 protein [Desulfarculaceae bacterium]
MPSPLVSVIMPVYNQEPYLREAVDSVLAQTWRDFELLVVNDGSSDRSREIVLSYRDPRVRLIDNPRNLGLASARNAGLRQARGSYIAMADGDDISLPQRLAKQVAFLEQHPDLDACSVGMAFFGEPTPSTGWVVANDPEQAKVNLLFFCPLPHTPIMYSRSLQREAGLYYDPTYDFAEDYEFLYRFCQVGRVGSLTEVLYLYRQHPRQISVANRDAQGRDSDRIRAMILRDLGLSPTPAELKLHSLVSTNRFQGPAAEPAAVTAWLGKLYAAVSPNPQYQQAKLRQSLWNIWLSFCLSRPVPQGLACLGRVFQSPLSSALGGRGPAGAKMLLYYPYLKLRCGPP